MPSLLTWIVVIMRVSVKLVGDSLVPFPAFRYSQLFDVATWGPEAKRAQFMINSSQAVFNTVILISRPANNTYWMVYACMCSVCCPPFVNSIIIHQVKSVKILFSAWVLFTCTHTIIASTQYTCSQCLPACWCIIPTHVTWE